MLRYLTVKFYKIIVILGSSVILLLETWTLLMLLNSWVEFETIGQKRDKQ